MYILSHSKYGHVLQYVIYSLTAKRLFSWMDLELGEIEHPV